MSRHSILSAIQRRLPRPRRKLVRDTFDPFFALSVDLLCITTLDGRFRRVNPAFVATLGYLESDLRATNILDLLHPQDRGAAATAIAPPPGNPATLQSRFRCASGAYKWLAWTSTPAPHTGLAYTVAHDRTPHKLVEDALRQSEARYVSALESTTDAFFAVDPAWRIVRVNHHAERLWMRRRDDILGRRLWDVFPEAVDGPSFRRFEEVMRNGPPAHFEKFDPASERWFEVHAYLTPDGLAVYFRDVTDRRQADEKIKRTVQEKEVLLREVHHRVKNNLQVICSMLRLQERNFTDETLLQALRECRERVLAMAMLHDQLHRAKDFSNINLGEYIRNLAASLFCSYGVNSAQVGLGMDVDDITAVVDIAIPCGLIVNELVSNSLRHAFPEGRKGGIALGLHAWPGGRVELTIADNGRGFLENPRANNTRSLGLWLVDLLAEQIGAAVERPPGAGTQYRFEFQVTASKETESNEQTPDHVS